MELPVLECKRCKHKWHPRAEKLPDVCPKCKTRYWNSERKLKYAIEKAAKADDLLIS
jgi:predicted Zn-ribbon and HTH transcriptional regulator